VDDEDDYDENGAVIEWRQEIIARAVHQHHRWLADSKERVWRTSFPSCLLVCAWGFNRVPDARALILVIVAVADSCVTDNDCLNLKQRPLMALRPGGMVCHNVRRYTAVPSSPNIYIRLPSHCTLAPASTHRAQSFWLALTTVALSCGGLMIVLACVCRVCGVVWRKQSSCGRATELWPGQLMSACSWPAGMSWYLPPPAPLYLTCSCVSITF
jgi:hypothetical protein